MEVAYIPSRGAAHVAIEIINSVPLAGTPDTTDIIGSFTDQNTCATQVNGPSGSLTSVIDSQTPFGFPIPVDGAQANPAFGAPAGGGNQTGFEGMLISGLWDLSALSLGTQPINTTTFNGPIATEKSARWSVISIAPIGSAATAVKAAGAAGVHHVIDCITFSAVSQGVVAAQVVVLEILDGASVIWEAVSAFPSAGALGIQEVPVNSFCGLALMGSAATSMTGEFNAAVPNASQSITMTGYDVQ